MNLFSEITCYPFIIIVVVTKNVLYAVQLTYTLNAYWPFETTWTNYSSSMLYVCGSIFITQLDLDTVKPYDKNDLYSAVGRKRIGHTWR